MQLFGNTLYDMYFFFAALALLSHIKCDMWESERLVGHTYILHENAQRLLILIASS